MDMSKKAYKKLTNANGLVRVFSIIALILGVIALLLEPIGRLIYNMIFTNKADYLIANTVKEYFSSIQYSLILFVLTIALMIAAFSSKNKKNIGQGFSSLLVLVPIATSVIPTIDLIDYLGSNTFKYMMKGADNLKFRALLILMVFILILCVAVLLLISGLVLVARASGEKPTEVTYIETALKKRPASQQGFNHQQQFNQFNPQQNQFNPNNGFAQPQGFNNNNTVGGFGAAPFAANNNNTQSPFAKPQDNAVPASAPLMNEIKTEMPSQTPAAQEDPKPSEPAGALPKVCEECGTVLADNAKFCKNCGKPV